MDRPRHMTHYWKLNPGGAARSGQPNDAPAQPKGIL